VGDVEEVLRHANSTLTAVVPRGAGSGLTGASSADVDEIVLDVSRMDTIVSIDAANRMAVVEPGVITAELDAAAREHGLRYAPDPASVAFSTIGGNIATNAGGVLGAKYGVTRDHVMELDVVTGAGQRLRTGSRTHKSVTGYDLTRLLVGSEGTLAVTTRAAVRLRPLVAGQATLLATFATPLAAAAAAQKIVLAGLDTAALELIDDRTIAAIRAATDRQLVDDGVSVLLLHFEGPSAIDEARRAERLLAAVSVGVEWTGDRARGAELFAARRLAIPSILNDGVALIEDIVVPIPAISAAMSRLRDVEEQVGLPIAVVAHAADGNLHPIISVPGHPTDSPPPPQAWEAADRVFEIALELGGSITGEHGAGLLKRKYVPQELGAVSMQIHRGIKAVFDPNGILNPGKGF
jgi:glycolate oxidase